MKNVTVTLDDDVLARARIEAALEGKSLSKFVAQLVEERLERSGVDVSAEPGGVAAPRLEATRRSAARSGTGLADRAHAALSPSPERSE